MDELHHLSDLLTHIGIAEAESPDDDSFHVRRTMMGYFEKNDDAHFKINTALAFGSADSAERSPYIAGGVAFILFILGSMTSVIPFAVTNDRFTGLLASFICTIVAILLVGAIKTWATKANCAVSAFENFVITSGGGAIAYAIGMGFNSIIKE